MVVIASTLVSIPQASNATLDIIANSTNLTSITLSPDLSSSVAYVPSGAIDMQDVFGFVGRDTGDSLGFTGFQTQIADDSAIGATPFDSLLGQSETQVVFAIGDTNTAGGNIVTHEATLSFDISSAISLTDIQMSFAAEGNWEAYTGSEDPFDNADGLDVTDNSWDVIEILGRIDGGAAFTVFAPEVNEAISVSNTLDNSSAVVEGDPFELKGTAIGSGNTPGGRSLQDFTSTTVNGLSGNTLELIVRANTNGGETMIFDNVLLNGLLCFAKDTLIATPDGEVAVQNLRRGDMILTADGAQTEVKWLGHQTLCKWQHGPHMQPVRIRAGALGGGLPHTDLTVTADHGMVFPSSREAAQGRMTAW